MRLQKVSGKKKGKSENFTRLNVGYFFQETGVNVGYLG